MQINPAPAVVSLLQRITHIESLAVLAAMITPALLISASGTFILSTSNRLARVVDRIRALSDKMEELLHQPPDTEMFEERRALLFNQMGQLSRRVTLLQNGLTFFYLAAALFIAASMAIGIVAVINARLDWIPGVLGVSGAFSLFYGSICLLREARIAVAAAREEMAFFDELTAHHRNLVTGAVR